ncbi:hypothetical protein H4582DRAFT_1804416, partial [Lactarius indigo]
SVNSSNEGENGITDELVTGIDRFGVQRCVITLPRTRGSLMPALMNRDWWEFARRWRAGANGRLYVISPGGQADTGTDGSVGRLRT